MGIEGIIFAVVGIWGVVLLSRFRSMVAASQAAGAQADPDEKEQSDEQ
jgi:hypothetical protein